MLIDEKEWKLVPVEPTEEMLEAVREWSYKKYGKPVGNDAAIGCHAALLSAAPKLPIDRDAERYRWLRENSQAHSLHMSGDHRYSLTNAACRLIGPSFDAAIDKAMSQGKVEEPRADYKIFPDGSCEF